MPSVVHAHFWTWCEQVYNGAMVCEPRHATWFSPAVASLLDQYEISRVAADPPPVAGQQRVPAGWPRVRIFSAARIAANVLVDDMTRTTLRRWRRPCAALATAEEVWCVFDNTASGAAIENAWELLEGVVGQQFNSKTPSDCRRILKGELEAAPPEGALNDGATNETSVHTFCGRHYFPLVLSLFCRTLLRHLGAGTTCLGQADRDRLFPTRDFLSRPSAPERAMFPLVHGPLNLARCFLAGTSSRAMLSFSSCADTTNRG